MAREGKNKEAEDRMQKPSYSWHLASRKRRKPSYNREAPKHATLSSSVARCGRKQSPSIPPLQ